MGTWGPGNLDSDGALDAVYTRSAALIKALWERVQKQESWEADEWDHDALFVDFETLLALEAGGVFTGSDLPTPGELGPVRETWLAGWDDYIEKLDPSEDFRARRRKVIVETFDRFEAVCAKYAKER